MILRYFLCWFLLALVAIANGLLRQGTYGKVVPELTAHQISTATGIVFTGIVVWLWNRTWPLESAGQALIIGAMWLGMTVLFEFGFGHFVAGHSWSHLFADYDLFQGRLWLLFLIWITIMPYLFYRWSLPAGRY